MRIEGFVKTTLRTWEGKNACNIVIADCDPGFPNYRPLADTAFVPADQGSVLEYIDGHMDFLTGVIISGGEPAGCPDLYKFLKEIKKRGLPIRIDTFGLFPDPLDDLIGARFADCVCVNMPAPLNKEDYSAAVGKDIDISPIIKTLAILEDSGVETIFRTVAAPGIIDEDSVGKIAEKISFAKYYYIIRSAPVKGTDDYSDTDLRKIGRSAKRFVKNVGVRDA